MKLGKKRWVCSSLLIALGLALFLPQILMPYSSSFVVNNLSFGVANASSNLVAASSTIIVPDNYPTISAAVGNASKGDTILVKKGTYYENPVIDKTLSIIGEDSNVTMVVGTGGVTSGARPVFAIAADNVLVSGFTIESLNYSTAALHASGVIVSGDNCTITNNNIVGTYYGVFCSVQSQTIVSHNNITGVLKDAVRFCGGFPEHYFRKQHSWKRCFWHSPRWLFKRDLTEQHHRQRSGHRPRRLV